MSARSVTLRSPAHKSGSEYLQEVLGDILAQALSAVAKARPRDPIKFVADFLRDVRRQQLKEELILTAEKNNIIDHGPQGGSDKDSGHFEDQEAPSNESATTTISSIELVEEDKSPTNYPERPSSSKANYNIIRRSQSHDDKTRNDTSSSDIEDHDLETKRRSRNRTRTNSRRRRTAESEPLPESVVSSSSVTYGKDARRRDAQSLNALDEKANSRKVDPRVFSKRVPLAALPWEEYRVKRGLKLPPMQSTPELSDFDEKHKELDIDKMVKPKQLRPLHSGSTEDEFNWKKHSRRNRRLLRENKIISNMV